MQQLSRVSQSRWLPLLLLGSMPMQVTAADAWFPVLRDSGTHWFSFLGEETGHPVPIAGRSAAPGGSERALLPDFLHKEDLRNQIGAHPDAYAAEDMSALGQLSAALRQRGQYAEAYQKLEQYYFLARVTRGLHHESHLPLLLEMAELAQLKGDVARAYELREVRKNLSLKVLAEDDPMRIEFQLEWADWLLQRYLKTEPQTLWSSQWEQNPWIDADFTESDRHYRLALEQAGRQQNLPVHTRMSVLLALRRWQLLHLAGLHRQLRVAGSLPSGPHTMGGISGHFPAAGSSLGFIARTLHETRLATKPSRPAELELQVAQLLLLGDWLHAMALSEQARRAYAQAYHLLEQTSLPAARIEQLLAPGLPVPDPERWYQAQNSSAAYQRHKDLTITIDANGNFLDCTIDSASTATNRELVRWLASSRFRPPLTGNSDRNVVALRVYHD